MTTFIRLLFLMNCELYFLYHTKVFAFKRMHGIQITDSSTIFTDQQVAFIALLIESLSLYHKIEAWKRYLSLMPSQSTMP